MSANSASENTALSLVMTESNVGSHAPLLSLFNQHQIIKQSLIDIAAKVNETKGVSYFTDGLSKSSNFHRSIPSIGEIFDSKHAVAALNADFWQRAIDLTDVLDHMAAGDRNTWNKAIQSHTTPEFEPDAVVFTLKDLLSQRHTLFLKRVDGIFQALSRDHVTNLPQGFYYRMIIAGATGYHGHHICAYIDDLRIVIDHLRGGKTARFYTDSDLRVQRKDGQWYSYDSGAIQMRTYLVGTVHLRVHPDLASELNAYLGQLHPLVIPGLQRAKKSAPKPSWVLRQDYLSAATLGDLAKASDSLKWRARVRPQFEKPTVFDGLFSCFPSDEKAKEILLSLGGVKLKHGIVFDSNVDVRNVLGEIARMGCVPEEKSHQAYFTEKPLADLCVEALQATEEHICLEPSAGLGALAKRLPLANTTVVEVSQVRCAALRQHGYKQVLNEDFLTVNKLGEFDRILMNPPFSEGRQYEHVLHAYKFLADGGRLVAVVLSGFDVRKLGLEQGCTLSEPLEDQFQGVSARVRVLTINKANIQ
jgi:Domain of unknown function (DUF4942)/Methyltransferase small domain